MREFTIAEKISKQELDFLENELGIKLPKDFRDLVRKYSGHRIVENCFPWLWNSKTHPLYISEFLDFTLMYDHSLQIRAERNEVLVPFAIDPSGMYFFLSYQEDHISCIRILAVDLSDNFITVAESLEEFINGLIAPNADQEA